MVERCPVCSRRTGSRRCPPAHGSVCPECCGRWRRRTLDCPNDCVYAERARRQALSRLAALSGQPDFELRWFDVLHNLRLEVARAMRTMSGGLGLQVLRAALANAGETMRIRGSGLIYEMRSADPCTQALTDQLLAAADRHTRGESGLRSATSEEVATCLKYLERQAGRWVERAMTAEGFLAVLAQSVLRSPLCTDGQEAVGQATAAGLAHGWQVDGGR